MPEVGALKESAMPPTRVVDAMVAKEACAEKYAPFGAFSAKQVKGVAFATVVAAVVTPPNPAAVPSPVKSSK